MTKKNLKLLALAVACVFTLGSTATVFAADTSTNDTPETQSEYQTIPIEFESEAPDTLSQGDSITFGVGSAGYISNCGFTPKFKMWVTGGNSSTQVTFNILTSGGVSYRQGPVRADGSNYIEKQYIVYNGGGSWRFTAYVSAGSNSGNLVCHVQQVY